MYNTCSLTSKLIVNLHNKVLDFSEQPFVGFFKINLALQVLLFKINYLKNMMTRLGVSIDVVMAASVSLSGWVCMEDMPFIYTLNKLISSQVTN